MGETSIWSATPNSRQKSGEGSIPSMERRSALECISLPTERIPLLQNGAPNAESGRLQEVPIQQLEEILTLPGSGGSVLPSSSRNSALLNGDHYDPTQDRSPIRSLSEDRLHVSLRVGPLFPDEDEELLAQRERTNDKRPAGAVRKPALAKKLGSKSPPQGVSVKKRRITKAQNSPRRRVTTESKKSGSVPV
ncbi:hypothetical protein Bca52824_021809 [Brassica carinata]|uniref:Uncharacterized protein n=1 Tax=Brassica carinata TaxID=52824 RepID=A0A8X8ASA5_BRACI|nr:hypothetical protein Bca52824_021809 [Brassica carinata]